MPSKTYLILMDRFISSGYLKKLNSGEVSWQSPSNIALVKYWGKYGNQLPMNASVSFTLSKSHTKTILSYEPNKTKKFKFEVYLDGKREQTFEPKIQKFFKRVGQFIPFLNEFDFKIETSNSFPHSSGIASSASGMSALALGLVEMERRMGSSYSDSFFKEKASFLARLGSGSACRSIEGPLVVWGEHPEIKDSSNLFGIKFPYHVHEVFLSYRDCILLVDKGEKQVSSTVGHQLMHEHPFAAQRFGQAQENLSKLVPIFKNGDIKEFIKIVESEALSLHAMMLTSMPYFILMKPNTLEIINRIWNYRNNNNSNICFTLDAGANVHLLYPDSESNEILEFVNSELSQFCKNGEFILDGVGMGAFKI